MKKNTLRLYVGNSARYRLTVREPAEDGNDRPAPVPLTGSLVRFEVKKAPDTHYLKNTDDVIISKTSDNANEIEVVDEAGGICEIKIVPDDTNFLSPGVYVYAINVETGVNDVYTVSEGKFVLMGLSTVAENLRP